MRVKSLRLGQTPPHQVPKCLSQQRSRGVCTGVDGGSSQALRERQDSPPAAITKCVAVNKDTPSCQAQCAGSLTGGR